MEFRSQDRIREGFEGTHPAVGGWTEGKLRGVSNWTREMSHSAKVSLTVLYWIVRTTFERSLWDQARFSVVSVMRYRLSRVAHPLVISRLLICSRQSILANRLPTVTLESPLLSEGKISLLVSILTCFPIERALRDAVLFRSRRTWEQFYLRV